MNKDKLTDPKDNTIENNIEHKKEDYTDSNGNPEAFIEDMTDPEATAIFKEAFYAESKALEEEALRSPFVEDEEKKEALRLRVLAAAGRSEEENVVLEHKAVLENQSNEAVTDKAIVKETATESTSGKTMTVSEVPMNNNDTVKASVEEVKKKKRKFTPFMRWAAVLALVCLGVFGVSVTGQAKGSGLWSSIQRLIGVETRWESENNGEDRTYTNPEEEKAVKDIEEKLEIEIPMFFYWPEKMEFSEYEIINEAERFFMVYTDGNIVIYFEGNKGDNNASAINAWQGEGKTEILENDNTTYTITEAGSDAFDKYYYVKWSVGENTFSLSGENNNEEIKKILKNIKN